MGRMYVLDSSGHTEVAWEAGDEQATGVARREFHRLRRRGYVPFHRESTGAPASRLTAFDERAHEIFWIRPVVGG